MGQGLGESLTPRSQASLYLVKLKQDIRATIHKDKFALQPLGLPLVPGALEE